MEPHAAARGHLRHGGIAGVDTDARRARAARIRLRTRPDQRGQSLVLGQRAARQDGASLKYTLPGYLTHHGASVFWAVIFERLFGHRARRDPVTALATGATVATLAAAIDYTITPKRLTPGYEERLSIPSLVVVYAAFAVGLALTEVTRRRRR